MGDCANCVHNLYCTVRPVLRSSTATTELGVKIVPNKKGTYVRMADTMRT